MWRLKAITSNFYGGSIGTKHLHKSPNTYTNPKTLPRIENTCTDDKTIARIENTSTNTKHFHETQNNCTKYKTLAHVDLLRLLGQFGTVSRVEPSSGTQEQLVGAKRNKPAAKVFKKS